MKNNNEAPLLPLDICFAERACRFAEWLQENRWFSFHQGKWNYSFEQGTSINVNAYNKNYKKTTEELYDLFVKEHRRQYELNRGALDQPSVTHASRWKCMLCGRDKFTRKSPHKCVGGFRKRKIIWQEI